ACRPETKSVSRERPYAVMQPLVVTDQALGHLYSRVCWQAESLRDLIELGATCRSSWYLRTLEGRRWIGKPQIVNCLQLLTTDSAKHGTVDCQICIVLSAISRGSANVDTFCTAFWPDRAEPGRLL